MVPAADPKPTPSPAPTAAGKLYDILASRKAPEQIGKPIWEKDMELVKMAGVRSPADLFGHIEKSQDTRIGRSLNFASKADVGMLPKATRMRLFLLKKMVSDCEIQAMWMHKTAHPTPDQMMATPVFKDMLEPTLKAFNVTDFSTWIPTVNARFYFEEFEIPLLVGDLFDTLPMESASVYIPGALGRLMGKLEGDAATFAAQSNTQAGYNVLAKNNVVHTEITEDLNQDSVPAVIEKLRKEVVMGVARAEEQAYLDGDVTGTHQDADVVAATDFRKAYNGIRKIALANSANGSVYDHEGDTPSKLLFASLLKRMGKFGSEKADLAWIMGPSISHDLVTGAIPELFTAFAFGGPASNVTGQVPPVFGIRGVESEWVREDLHESGVYTIAAQTKTWLGLVKKSRVFRHMRAPIRVWAAPSLPSSDKMLMTAKKRHTFSSIPQSATEKSIVIGVNIETASA